MWEHFCIPSGETFRMNARRPRNFEATWKAQLSRHGRSEIIPVRAPPRCHTIFQRGGLFLCFFFVFVCVGIQGRAFSMPPLPHVLRSCDSIAYQAFDYCRQVATGIRRKAASSTLLLVVISHTACPFTQTRIQKTFRHRDSNPGRSGESRVS